MPRDPALVLHELQRPDERSLAFNPYGLGGRLDPRDAAAFQADSIASATLHDDVPQAVHENFERARKLHLYGALEYQFFTAASEYALLVLEGALRLRFLTYYPDGIPVISAGIHSRLRPDTFDELRQARGGKLVGLDGAIHALPLGAPALTAWARRERLLIGTRSRILDKELSGLRNRAAHPVEHTLTMPPDSARTLCDIAETINRLWGHDTPRGRLFPPPVARTPTVAAIAPQGRAGMVMRLEQVSELAAPEREWEFAVFLAAGNEKLLRPGRGGVITFVHQPGLQATVFPTEELWKGDWQALREQIDKGQFEGREDAVAHLDRLFFIRVGEDTIDLARSAPDVLALPASKREGDWYAITADTPNYGWVHVRDHEPHPADGGNVCPECFAVVHTRRKNAAHIVGLASQSLAPG
jgi:hypothetical protein